MGLGSVHPLRGKESKLDKHKVESAPTLRRYRSSSFAFHPPHREWGIAASQKAKGGPMDCPCGLSPPDFHSGGDGRCPPMAVYPRVGSRGCADFWSPQMVNPPNSTGVLLRDALPFPAADHYTAILLQGVATHSPCQPRYPSHHTTTLGSFLFCFWF